MAAKFPRRRPDGSFSVEVSFKTQHEVDRADVEQWLREWMEANAEWVREWRTGADWAVVETEYLRWSDAFARTPSVATVGRDAIVLRLDATPRAAFWRDWLAKLAGAMAVAYPGLTFERVTQVEP